MEFLTKLLDFITQILVKFIPGRKEKAIDQYRKTAKTVEEKQSKRENKRRARQEAKAILSSVHDCDKLGC